jgi:acetyl-CoA synthetase
MANEDFTEQTKEYAELKEEKVPVFQPTSNKPIHISSLSEYKKLYKESISDSDTFWKKKALDLVDWFTPFSVVQSGDLTNGNITWFQDGILNVCYNCVDRHALKSPEKVAFIWEQDEPGNSVKITYRELLENVCRVSNVLLKWGIRKGDSVAIYMPMIPEAAYSILACARIGAVHSVVFAGFSSDALRDRIQDARCRFLITADQGKRGGKLINLKKIADEALVECASIEHVLLFQHTKDLNTAIHKPRDLIWEEEVLSQRPYCPPAHLNAEDPLFLLYTSGSTGKPKGLLHTQGGYLVGITSTLKVSFNHLTPS